MYYGANIMEALENRNFNTTKEMINLYSDFNNMDNSKIEKM